ncbi:MAG TPA: ribbon-helix-helix domain-containing protein [Rhizorhapis sp.]|nr:ribbon-helix-helix domain-containing protein [Rhizorhapis sp.]
MNKSNVVTARLDSETLKALDRLAKYQERTRSWLVAQAVARYVDEESAFFNFLSEGDAAIERGEYLTQDQMESWFEERSAARNGRQSSAE